MSSRSSGAWGEELALRYLAGRGYSLVERNYGTRRGKIDLIVRKEDTLVFVEVKMRRGTACGDPLEAVTPRKQTALRKFAVEYLSDRNPHFDTLRSDVVGILVGKDGLRVRQVQDAF